MNKNEYMQSTYLNLKENIGETVTCILNVDGVKKTITGLLLEVCDNYYISIGNNKYITDIIPFEKDGYNLLAILSNREVLYMNTSAIEKDTSSFDNKIKQNQLSMNEKKALYLLKKILLIDYKYGYYANSLCIEKVNDEWKVYITHKGNIFNERHFSTIHEVAMYIINLTKENQEFIKNALLKYSNYILQDNYPAKELDDFINRFANSSKVLKK